MSSTSLCASQRTRFLAASLTLLALAGTASAQAGPWSATTISQAADGAFAVYGADVDRDGDMDALSGSGIDNTIAWYENNLGDGTSWTLRTISNSAAGAHLVTTADMDGDGDVDVLSASFSDSTIAWYQNTSGNGTTWTKRIVTSSALQAKAAVPGDVDGDGDFDILIASTTDDRIAWYENVNGNGLTWASHTISTLADAAISAYGADVDGDGDLDVLSASASDDKVAWYENTAGDGTAWIEHTISLAAQGANSVVAKDVDGDGDVDALSASASDDKIAWYENTAGDGSAWTEHVIFVGADVAVTIFASDLDDDGDIDALSASQNDDSIRWYENTSGDGSTWTAHVISSAADGAFSVFAADVDGDGDTDVFSASRLDDKIAWYENMAAIAPSLICGDTKIASGMTGALDVVAGDFDKDGDTDVLAAAKTADEITWYGNATGNGATWTPQLVSAARLAPTAVFAADVDGDGDLDALSSSEGDDTIAWHENTAGDGSAWTEHLMTVLAEGAQDVFAADVDGDGDMDGLSASFDDDTIAWYVNSVGDGSTWIERNIDNSADGARAVYAADLDGDGDVDVLSASELDDTIAWHENLAGDGLTWSNQVIASTADGACAVHAADLDHDGDLDVLSASEFDDSLAWHENTVGDGSIWIVHTISITADGARSISAADVDEDGDIDVLSASGLDDKVAWFENTAGDGSAWSEHTISDAADGASAIFVADIDGDGGADAVSAQFDGNRVVWYEDVPSGDLVGCPTRVSLAAGGSQRYTLDAGPGNGFELFVLMTTTTGTTPGQALPPSGLTLPLNFSQLFLTTALQPNVLIPGSLNLLDMDGRQAISLTLPPGLSPSLAGVTLHSAYMLVDLMTFNATYVSLPVPLTLVP